jgi:hypothetical protein
MLGYVIHLVADQMVHFGKYRHDIFIFNKRKTMNKNFISQCCLVYQTVVWWSSSFFFVFFLFIYVIILIALYLFDLMGLSGRSHLI